MKEIIDRYNKKYFEAYTIMMDFMKACDQIEREIIEMTMREMNFGEIIIEITQLSYATSSVAVVESNATWETTRALGGARKDFPVSPFLFEIVLKLMLIEMRSEEGMKWIVWRDRDNAAARTSNIKEKIGNEDERLSIITNDSSTIVTSKKTHKGNKRMHLRTWERNRIEIKRRKNDYNTNKKRNIRKDIIS